MGAPWYGVYLWVTLGNGFRYGEKYLYVSGMASLAGFGVVVFTTPYWATHQELAVGLTVTLLVIPAYSAILIRRLSEARQRADSASRAKSDFLSRMSHEIRTPLNGILGMTDLLRSRPLAVEDREYVETIHASGKMLAHQIDEILDLSKIEAGQLTLEYLDFDLHALINTTLRIFEPKAHGKRLQLQETINPATPFSLYGDPHKLRQIIINLVGNAVKFTDQGFVTLRVYPREQSDGRVTLRFEVADSGNGIPEDRLQSIFRPFAQADSSISRSYGGTGLGTTICKHLVELMGGTIGVQSSLNVGTTFWFDLPFTVTRGSALNGETAWSEKCRVVYLRGRDRNADPVDLVLRKWNMQLQTIHTLGEAVPFVSAAQPGTDIYDALVLDGVGYCQTLESLLDMLESEHAFTSMPVVVIGTENYPPEITNRINERLFLLPSPVDKRVLFNTMHACYSRHSTEEDVIQIASKRGGTERSTRPLRVLVGDDNATNRLVLLRMLEKAGHQCEAVTGGEDVLNALERSHYDAAIVDKNMPDMSGIDVYSAYAMAHGGRPPVKFIILTADATAESRDACAAAGIECFLTKPVSLSKLQSTLAEVTRGEPHAIARKPEVTEPDSTPETEMPVIDTEELDKLEMLAGGDRTFLPEMLANFERDAEQDLQGMEIAVGKRDWQGFCDCAHALKGAALYLGLRQLSFLSAEAQNLSHKGFEEHGIDQIQALRKAAASALNALRKRIGSPRKIS
jgi:two-component system sensor histidine kinase RpfC